MIYTFMSISFKDWVLARESTAKTRTDNAVANGLAPLAALGSPHGHSTLRPSQEKSISKQIKDDEKSKKKKKRSKKTDKH